jgi:hypothetical protein
MKRIVLYIALVALFSGKVFSQGNTLVFNQVLTFANSNITTSPYVVATVPAGKAWKLAYMGAYRYSYQNPFVISTGSGENEASVFTTGTPTSNPTPHGPVWLKAGDTIKVVYGSGSYPITYFVSVIEFNIVPL